MQVYSKDDLFIGCRVHLNDGRDATVTDDVDDDELVQVRIDDDEQDTILYVGEPLNRQQYPLWVSETLLEVSGDDDYDDVVIDDLLFA
jgi:hypothetical protein